MVVKFTFCLIAVFTILHCSMKTRSVPLTVQEKKAIAETGLDADLVRQIKSLCDSEFHMFPNAAKTLREVKEGKIILSHGVRYGYFDVEFNFDDDLLEEVRTKWSKDGYKIYTVRQYGKCRIMISS